MWRIEPATNEAADTVGVGSKPMGIASGDGALWVAGYGSVTRIDPRTRTVVKTLHVGPSAAEIAAVGDEILVSVDPAYG